jgi:DNA-binding LacI/PurR family transcriptional regulator
VTNRGTTDRKPTQADVGRLAGVSVGVVSAVVNNRMDGSIRVGSATEARVRDAIAKLAYVPNMAARQLAGGRNNILGVFTYSSIFPTATDDYYYPMLAGIEKSAELSGQNLLLFTGNLAADGTRSIYENDGSNRLQLADGAVLLGRTAVGEDLRRLTSAGYPFVYIGRRTEAHVDVSFVAADYARATADAVTRAVDLGHRRIAMIASDLWHPSMEDRTAGYREARAALAGTLTSSELYSVPSTEPIDAIVTSIIGQGVTCIFVADCLVAQAAIDVARRAGLSVPDDLSIVALSDYPGGPDEELASITTVETPSFDLGRAAIDLLLNLLNSPSGVALHSVVECGFREGSTLAIAPNARSSN